MFGLSQVRRYLSASIAAGLLVASASACYSYQAARPHALSAEEAKHPVRVVRLHGGGEVTLQAPRVSGDTLYGRPTTGTATGEVAIPFSDIYTVAARNKDTMKTTALAAGAALVVALTVTAVGISSSN